MSNKIKQVPGAHYCAVLEGNMSIAVVHVHR